jgi:murein DD-endopeptidase MepM/ murein hydrolase activator NlpD
MKLLDVASTDLANMPSAPKKRDDIDKVAREFESLLVNELFKVMRKTSEGSYLSNQLSKNFQSMLDQEYANLASTGEGFGLSDMLADQLGNQLFGQETKGEKFLRSGQWAFPVSGDMTLSKGQKFGADRSGLRPDDCGDGHCGIDLGRAEGTPIVAAGGGRITRINRNESIGGGIYVGISHYNGTLETRYMHMSKIADGLKLGDSVEKGQYIGDVGNTGKHSTGAHLHFEIFENTGKGKRRYIDPEPYLARWREKTPENLEKGENIPKVHVHSGDVDKDESGKPCAHDAVKRHGLKQYRLGQTGGG